MSSFRASFLVYSVQVYLYLYLLQKVTQYDHWLLSSFRTSFLVYSAQVYLHQVAYFRKF